MNNRNNITAPAVDKTRVYSKTYHHYLAFSGCLGMARYGRYWQKSLSQDGHHPLMASSKRHTAPRRPQSLMA